MTSVSTKPLTFEAWCELPETKHRCEVVDGVLHMPPGPTFEHQWDSTELFQAMYWFVRDRGLGVVLPGPCEMVIRREPLRVRQPDILYCSVERTGIAGREQLRGLQRLEIPPDIVVEVLSPSNTPSYVEVKLNDYRELGVQECWLLSARNQAIEVVDLAALPAPVRTLYSIDERLQSRALPGFVLPIREIFR